LRQQKFTLSKERFAMRDPTEIETGAIRTIPILSVSPIEEDHLFLKDTFSIHPSWTPSADSDWKLHTSRTLESALTALQQNEISIVICERDLLPGTWKDMLARIKLLPTPPLLIVTSRLADEHLWAEAMNLGAYDVVPKPFDSHELSRIISFAWLHWNDKYATSPPKVMTAGGA
jgi:response regulator RpfG family c-di-GMP phosphodiesterase